MCTLIFGRFVDLSFPEEWPIKFTTNVGSALSWFFAWDIVVIFTLSTVQWLRSRIPTIYLTVEENGGSDTLTGGNGGGYTLRAWLQVVSW